MLGEQHTYAAADHKQCSFLQCTTAAVNSWPWLQCCTMYSCLVHLYNYVVVLSDKGSSRCIAGYSSGSCQEHSH
jgi:hypothetical protein